MNNEERRYCVYIHKCLINEKVYIGMTCDVKNRWRCNGINYKPHDGKEWRSPFWNAIKKYGWDSFSHEILEENLTFKEACDKEKYYIQLYNSRDNNYGYNIAAGGNGGHIYKNHPRGMLGKHHSIEKRRQQRELMIRLNKEGKAGNTWKNGHPRGMLGKHHSEEYKERLRSIPAGEHPSAKKIAIKYPDGKIVNYDCKKYLVEDLHLSGTLVNKILKSGEPYTVSKSCHSNVDNLKKIEGCIIYYIENAEVTK